MFKKLAVIAVLFGMVMSVTVAFSNGTPPEPKTKTKPASAPALFEGTSSKGNLEEALKTAIESAMASRKGIADAMVEWKIKEISGAQGGIAGVNRLTVTIEVRPQ